MDFMMTIKRSTPAECREMGELLLHLAQLPRDGAWDATIEAAAAKFTPPQNSSVIAAIEAGRRRAAKEHDALVSAGMDHETLANAELARRGDSRTFGEYRSEQLYR